MDTPIAALLGAIPQEAREYLSAGDGLGQASVQQRHPNIQETLGAPATRAAIVAWLAHGETATPPNAGFVTRCLQYLGPKAAPHEAHVVRRFLLHSSASVRTAAYEFFIALYFPDRNREALYMLLNTMMIDPDDGVRAQAVRYIERAGATEELRPFLTQWRAGAYQSGWGRTSAYELVERLLGEPSQIRR